MWDFRYDTRLKDWVFAPNYDYAGAGGIDVIKQRIMTRLFIQRGTWVYDPIGNLGSRLSDLFTVIRPETYREVEIMVLEALAPMDDIEIRQIVISVPPPDEPGVQLDLGVLRIYLDIIINQEVFALEEPGWLPLANTAQFTIDLPL